MAGTTGGGAFRYPYEHTTYTDALRQAFTAAGVPDEIVEEWNYLTMDRDRALEDYLTVAAAAVGSFFDAIVDASLVSSDSPNRLFRGIGEAISFLGALGLTSVTIGVKPNASITAYQEPASISSGVPAKVRIIGAGVQPPGMQAATNQVNWDLRGRSIAFTEVQIENVILRSSLALSNGATDLFNASAMTTLVLKDCMVFSNSTFMNQLSGVSNDTRIFLYNTSMSNMSFGRAAVVLMSGGELQWSSSYTFTTQHQNSAAPTGGTGGAYLVGVGLRGTSATVSLTWNNTNCASIIMSGCAILDRGFIQFIPSASRLTLTFPSGTSPQLDIATRVANASVSLNIVVTSPNNGWHVHVKNMHFNNSADTSFTKTGTNYGTVQGDFSRVDITGGARVSISMNASLGSSTAILRGNGISGDIVMQSNTGATAFQGIGLLRAAVRCVFHTFSTMNQAWTLDAASIGNIIDFAGASVATNPGVDSGSANIVRQT